MVFLNMMITVEKEYSRFTAVYLNPAVKDRETSVTNHLRKEGFRNTTVSQYSGVEYRSNRKLRRRHRFSEEIV